MLFLLPLLQIIPLRYCCAGSLAEREAGRRLGNLFTFVTLQPHRRDTTKSIKEGRGHIWFLFTAKENILGSCNASTFEFPSLGNHLHLAPTLFSQSLECHTFKEQAKVGPKSLIFPKNDHQLIYSKGSVN